MEEKKFCEDCGRRLGVACVCGLSFAERIKTQQINRFSLMDKDRQRHGRRAK